MIYIFFFKKPPTLFLEVFHRWKSLFWLQIRNPHEKWACWFFWNRFFYREKRILELIQKLPLYMLCKASTVQIFEWALKSVFLGRKTCFKKTNRPIFHGDFESVVKIAIFTYEKPLKTAFVVFKKKDIYHKKDIYIYLFFKTVERKKNFWKFFLKNFFFSKISR